VAGLVGSGKTHLLSRIETEGFVPAKVHIATSNFA